MSDLKKKRKFWLWFNIPLYLFAFCLWFGYETLLLKNVPLFLMCVFVFGTLFLLNKVVQRRFVPPPEVRTWRMAKMVFTQMGVTVVFLLAVLCVMWCYVPPVAISERTTYLTEPRTADGKEVDILAAIEDRFAAKGKPEENGFRKVVELFGPEQVFTLAPEDQEEHTALLCRQLELSVPGGPFVKFQPAYDYYYDYYKNQEAENAEENPAELRDKTWKITGRMSCKPWNTGDIEGAEIWLEENAEAMNRFGEAVRMPYYYAPIFIPPGAWTTLERLYAEYNFHRNMTAALNYRIMNSLARGDHEMAFYDVETLLRFADAQMRHVDSTMQFFHARISQGTAVQAVTRLVKYERLTKDQVRELNRVFQECRTVLPFSDTIFLIRLEGTHLLYELASGRILESKGIDLEWYQLLGGRCFFAMFKYFPWNEIFKDYQRSFGPLESIARQPISRKQLMELIEWENANSFWDDFSFKQYFFTIFQKGMYFGVPGFMGKIHSRLVTYSISGYAHSYYHGITTIRQAELAMALEFYRWDYGEYPATLDALQGVYLDEIPGDPFTDGEPFCYVLTEHDGEPSYTLYSVGPDGEDDGGQNSSNSCACGGCDCDEEASGEQPPPKRTDDIAFKMGGFQ